MRDDLTHPKAGCAIPIPRNAKAYARRKGLKSMINQPRDFQKVNAELLNPGKPNVFRNDDEGEVARMAEALVQELFDRDDANNLQWLPATGWGMGNKSSAWQFRVGNNLYRLCADEVSGGKYSIAFKQVTDDKGDDLHSYGITKSRNQFKIFSTVISLLTTFASKVNPKVMMFTAHEKSRKRLYSSIVDRFAKVGGYTVKVFHGPSFDKYYLTMKKMGAEKILAKLHGEPDPTSQSGLDLKSGQQRFSF